MIRKLTLVLVLVAVPAAAQEPADPPSLMERGAELFFKGLREEMVPRLDDLRGFAEEFGPSMRQFLSEMGPAFGALIDDVKDWTRYEPPVMLPNGDIILRKKPDPDPKVTPVPPDGDAPPPGMTDI